jgi:hypothetical protein
MMLEYHVPKPRWSNGPIKPVAVLRSCDRGTQPLKSGLNLAVVQWLKLPLNKTSF